MANKPISYLNPDDTLYIPDNLLLSTAITPLQKFIKGIYGLKNNQALMKIKTVEELQQLSTVSHISWHDDHVTLEKLGIKNIAKVSRYRALFTRVAYRYIDFVLLDFPNNKSGNRISKEITLVPVPNLAIESKGTRHFVLSSTHPDSNKVYQALNQGLAIMQAQGLLNEYYQQAKIIRADLTHLTILNKN